MPKNINIKSILIIGAGPIIIGQGCEFDYSGVQACKSLKEEGYRTILVNSNPATIMTDPEICDSTYIEPINPDIIIKILEKEKPDAILPTVGGQTALNCTIELINRGILKKFAVKLIGVSETAIKKAEDREQFQISMQKIGLETPKGKIVTDLESAIIAQKKIGFPVIIRPFFTLGGSGGGIANNLKELKIICKKGLSISPVKKILLEESLIGWKEFELEVVRDNKDNCIIVCTIENLDPMGTHTGDSITIVPAQTLTDKEYQRMRKSAIEVLREIGVETGGANVQFAIHPKTGRMVVIEMNPRVSRSSALASKATGFPIAKIAAKLAVGYTLDELNNDITTKIPASFEPVIDYVVTKIPKFNFEKFNLRDTSLGVQMQSVGEVMAIGRTFQESFQKALLSLEDDFDIFLNIKINNLHSKLKTPSPYLIKYIAQAFRQKFSLERIHNLTHIDPWFLYQINDLINMQKKLLKHKFCNLNKKELFFFKQKGFSDASIARALNVKEENVRSLRHQLEVHPVFKRIDTCSAEFPSETAYFYSTYEQYCESYPSNQRKIIILGAGSNRIGQGIEFDYCSVHAILALRESGYETIMINCNPETVSTDYDVADRLYFEPISLEHVLEIIMIEKPTGVIIQYGGQTPLKLAHALKNLGVPIIGSSLDSIDCVEDRKRFSKLLRKLSLNQAEYGIASAFHESKKIVKKIGFPILVRPSYVLGGRYIKIIKNIKELKKYFVETTSIFKKTTILMDKFLEQAIEVDVDAVCDGKEVLIGGILEHVEDAGIHSGDSICLIPPLRLNNDIEKRLRDYTIKISKALSVIGPINIQFAIKNEKIFVLEANLRASRTFPFVYKATGISLAKIGAICMIGKKLEQQNILVPFNSKFSVKFPVFSFNKLIDVDPQLGPEMKSTGEIMGIGNSLDEAFIKAIIETSPIPSLGEYVYISTDNKNITVVLDLIEKLKKSGFNKIYIEEKTSSLLYKTSDLDEYISNSKKNTKKIGLAIILNKNFGSEKNLSKLRKYCLQNKINYLTNILSVRALINSMEINKKLNVYKLQELFST